MGRLVHMSLSPTLPIWHRCLTHDSIPADIELFSEAGGDASVSKSELARIRGFEVTKAGAKGLGVFALQDFYRGDLVIAEAPLFSIRRVRVEGHGGIQYRCGTIEAAIDALTPEKRRGYESLDNARPREMCRCGIFSTNSFGVDEDDSVKIFLQCSRFNHSCTPNARYSWNPEVERFRIYAFRDIARGEEIFVTYLGRDTYWSTRAERQARLQPRGFTCTCAVCTQPNTAASDERRVRIKKIWESRSNLTPDNSDEYLLAIVHAIHLLKEEGCADGYDEFTDVAAWICAIHSDWASAKYWATETYKAKVAEFGEDNYMAKEAKEMLEDPKTAKMAGMGPRKTFSVRL